MTASGLKFVQLSRDAHEQFDPPENNLGVIPLIILNWNGESDTIKCLKSIQRSDLALFLPVVIDNGSKTESLDALKRESLLLFRKVVFLNRDDIHPGAEFCSRFAELDRETLIFVECQQNLGFAGGSNIGIELSEILGATWVMLLNNDTVVASDLFQTLTRFLKSHREFVALTPQIRELDATTTIQNCGGDLTLFGSRRYRFANRPASALCREGFSKITFVTGCALLFNRKILGRLTEDFFFGEEDYEFSLRIQRLGLDMACVHDAVVYHRGGSTIGRNGKAFGLILLQYVSRFINTRNYYSRPRWLITRLLGYLYLPILLHKNSMPVSRSISAIRIVESYVSARQTVRASDFEAIINLQ